MLANAERGRTTRHARRASENESERVRQQLRYGRLGGAVARMAVRWRFIVSLHKGI
eukprot:COSAG06_NODE_64719_length_258_cov_14.716981_1_plen_55_part_10